MELRGRGALITGASKGLGAALAAEMARLGARVALVARGAAELEAVAARIRAQGGEAHALPADVGDKRAIRARWKPTCTPRRSPRRIAQRWRARKTWRGGLPG